MFSGHSTAADLIKNLNDGLTGIDPSKNLQISMDGPNVKSLEMIKKEREEAKLSKLIDIGSRDLHAVHRSLKTACEKLNGSSNVYLKVVFKFLKTHQLVGKTTFLSLARLTFHCSFAQPGGLDVYYCNGIQFVNILFTLFVSCRGKLKPCRE